MGRGGFPPSETGSFSAHHTAQRVGLFLEFVFSICFERVRLQPRRERGEIKPALDAALMRASTDPLRLETFPPARLSL